MDANYKFITTLPVKDVLERIKGNNDNYLEHKLLELNTGWSIKLFYNHGFQNSFRPVFRGQIFREQDNTVIRGDFAINKSVKYLRTIILITAIIFCFVLIGISGMTKNAAALIGLLGLASVILVLFVIEKLGKYLSKNDKVQIIRFFEEELEAKQNS